MEGPEVKIEMKKKIMVTVGRVGRVDMPFLPPPFS